MCCNCGWCRAKKKIFELRKIIYRKKLTIKFRSLTSNGRRGALINTVEHPLPVLTSPRPTTTFYKLFGNSKYAHTIEIQGGTKKKMETWCHKRHIKKCLRFEKKMRAKDIYRIQKCCTIIPTFWIGCQEDCMWTFCNSQVVPRYAKNWQNCLSINFGWACEN